MDARGNKGAGFVAGIRPQLEAGSGPSTNEGSIPIRRAILVRQCRLERDDVLLMYSNVRPPSSAHLAAPYFRRRAGADMETGDLLILHRTINELSPVFAPYDSCFPVDCKLNHPFRLARVMTPAPPSGDSVSVSNPMIYSRDFGLLANTQPEVGQLNSFESKKGGSVHLRGCARVWCATGHRRGEVKLSTGAAKGPLGAAMQDGFR